MRRVTHFLGILTLGLLVVGSGSAWAQSSAPASTQPTAASKKSEEYKESKAMQSAELRHSNMHFVRGRITAIDTSASPETVTMNVGRGKNIKAMGVEVPSTVKIMEGKSAKTLSDVKVGDRVAMRYAREKNRLVAEQIHILGGGHIAKAGSHTGNPAASKKS